MPEINLQERRGTIRCDFVNLIVLPALEEFQFEIGTKSFPGKQSRGRLSERLIVHFATAPTIRLVACSHEVMRLNLLSAPCTSAGSNRIFSTPSGKFFSAKNSGRSSTKCEQPCSPILLCLSILVGLKK